MSILGNRVVRVEDPRLLTDGGTLRRRPADPRLAGAVHATYVRSTMAHAAAHRRRRRGGPALPGVVAVVTGADVDLPADPRAWPTRRWPARCWPATGCGSWASPWPWC